MKIFSRLILVILIIALTGCGKDAQAAKYAQTFEFLLTQQRASGVVLSGGKVYFYVPGTETLKTIYADRLKTTPASNPATLSADGTVQIFGDGLYDVKVTNSALVQKYFWEDILIQSTTAASTNLSDYGSSLATAISSIGSTPTTLLIDVNTSLAVDATIPATMEILPVNNSVITIASGKTLTINGPFFPSRVKVFDGAGTAVLAKSGPIMPEWFGAVGDDTTDDTAALAKTFTASTTIKQVSLGTKTYKSTASITVPEGVEIHGTGGDYSNIRFYNCDGLILSDYSNEYHIGPYVLSNFGVMGNSTGNNSYIGIKYLGGASTNTRLFGLRLDNVRVHWFNTGISLRGAWWTNIENCVLNNVYNGVKVLGQSVVTTLRNNHIVSNAALGTGGSSGVTMDSAFDYDPGGNTEHRPENLTISNNLIYGFGTGVNLIRGLEVRVIDNDLDNCLSYGILTGTIDGNQYLVDNWIATYTDAAFIGIYLVDLAASLPKVTTVKGNFILGKSGMVNTSTGIYVGIKQYNVVVEGNTSNYMTAQDIFVHGAASTKVRDNTLLSTGSTYSINVDGTVAGSYTIIEGNYAENVIFVHPTVNAGVFDIGMNGGLNSTKIYGQITILEGATTATRTFASLPGAPPDFDTLSAFITPTVSFSSPTSNVGAIWGDATDSAVTVNCETAAPVGGTTIRFEVKGIATFSLD